MSQRCYTNQSNKIIILLYVASCLDRASTVVDQGDFILLVVEMSWSTYGGNSPETLFDSGEESKYNALYCSKMPGLWSQVWVEQFVCRDCVNCILLKRTFCCYIIEDWGENSNFQPTCASRQSSANTGLVAFYKMWKQQEVLLWKKKTISTLFLATVVATYCCIT